MFERCAGNFERNRSDDSITIDVGFCRAKNILQKEEVPFEEFEKVYGNEKIRADKAYVEEMEKRFKDGPKLEKFGNDCATILEALSHTRFKNGKWLPAGVAAIKTNRFDDIAHGIDEVIYDPDGDILFGIDIATTGSGPLNVGISKKMEGIKNGVLRKSLPEVTYMKDPRSDKVGVKNVPKVVVGATVDTVKKLNEHWLDREFEDLNKHGLQIQFLEQIVSECNVFAGFATRNSAPEIAEQYSKIKTWALKKIKEQGKNTKQDFYGDNATAVIENAMYPLKESLDIKRKVWKEN